MDDFHELRRHGCEKSPDAVELELMFSHERSSLTSPIEG